MAFNYVKKIESCRECPYASNNAQEHDDPYTSTPSHLYWYCNQGGQDTRAMVRITDAYKISDDCPLNSPNASFSRCPSWPSATQLSQEEVTLLAIRMNAPMLYHCCQMAMHGSCTWAEAMQTAAIEQAKVIEQQQAELVRLMSVTNHHKLRRTR